MRKGLVLVVALVLMGAILSGCPAKKQDKVPGPSPATAGQIKSPEEAAALMKEHAASKGKQIEVTVQDVNGNGVADLVVTWKSPVQNDDDVMKAIFFVSGMAASLGRDAGFPTDLIVLKVGARTFRARVSDLTQCLQAFESDQAEDKLIGCVAQAWGLK